MPSILSYQGAQRNMAQRGGSSRVRDGYEKMLRPHMVHIVRQRGQSGSSARGLRLVGSRELMGQPEGAYG